MTSQPHPIPWGYRLALTWIEPLFAFSGAVQAYFSPQTLLAISNPGVTYTASLHPLFTQFAGSWLSLVFNDAVTLRMTRDVRIWSCLVAAGLVSDVLYTLSLAEDIGAAVFFRPRRWDANNWTAIVTTVPMALVKVMFLARVGFAGSSSSSVATTPKTIGEGSDSGVREGRERRGGGRRGVTASGSPSREETIGPIKAD